MSCALTAFLVTLSSKWLPTSPFVRLLFMLLAPSHLTPLSTSSFLSLASLLELLPSGHMLVFSDQSLEHFRAISCRSGCYLFISFSSLVTMGFHVKCQDTDAWEVCTRNFLTKVCKTSNLLKKIFFFLEIVFLFPV